MSPRLSICMIFKFQTSDVSRAIAMLVLGREGRSWEKWVYDLMM